MLNTTIRNNKCKCMIANFEVEEGKTEDVTKKMKEVNLNENKPEDI